MTKQKRNIHTDTKYILLRCFKAASDRAKFIMFHTLQNAEHDSKKGKWLYDLRRVENETMAKFIDFVYLEHFIGEECILCETNFEWFWLSCLIMPLKWQCTHRNIEQGRKEGKERKRKMILSTFKKIARHFQHDANAIIDKKIHLHSIFVCLFVFFVPFPIHTKDYKIKTIVSKLFVSCALNWALDDAVSFVFGFVCRRIRYFQCEMVILFKLTTNSVRVEDLPFEIQRYLF